MGYNIGINNVPNPPLLSSRLPFLSTLATTELSTLAYALKWSSIFLLKIWLVTPIFGTCLQRSIRRYHPLLPCN
jgi:hypothetical protein